MVEFFDADILGDYDRFTKFLSTVLRHSMNWSDKTLFRFGFRLKFFVLQIAQKRQILFIPFQHFY